MIDSTNNNNGTNGLATALRDRSTCTIPVQPNRSLPVRPAPHIPCRNLSSKRMSKKHEADQTKNGTLHNIHDTKEIVTTLTPSTESSSVNINLQQLSSASPSSSSPSSSLSLSRSLNRGLIRINGTHWQNEMRLPIINIIGITDKNVNEKNNEGRGNMGRSSTKRKMDDDVIKNGSLDDNNYNTQNNCNFIDITKSPERCHDFSMNFDSSSSNCSKNDSMTLNDNDNDREKSKTKKRRKRKEKKSSNNNMRALKIVPPLRLKKIQCLQEKNVTNCTSESWSYVHQLENRNESKKPADDIGFRYYQANVSPKKIIVGDNTAEDWPNKYRIVSGQTLSNAIDIRDQSSLISDNNDEELRYRQHKLQIKLCELKKKTVELGREMLRTAYTSPNNFMQGTIESYEKQIKTLTNLLTTLPETSTDNNITVQIAESPIPSTIVSSSSFMSATTHTLASSYCDSSQSPGPPKLSPKIIIESGMVESPCRIRNSPPILPKINLTNDDDCAHWSESEFSKEISKNNHEKLGSASVTTTSECLIDDEIDIDDKTELLDFTLNDIIESDTNTNIISESDSVNRQGTDKRNQECANEQLNKNTSFTNSDSTNINVSNSTINDIPKRKNIAISPKLTSSCNTLRNSPTYQSTMKNDETAPVDKDGNNFIISHQFPSLGKWLTNTYSAKKFQYLTENMRTTSEAKKWITNENQLPVIQHTPYEHFNQVHKLIIPPDTSTNKNVPEQNNTIGESQWNNEQWQHQTHLSQNSTATNANISIGPNQYCPPVPLTGHYTRNYPMDSCGPYSFTHPTIAGTVNTGSAASLWNNTIHQHPLMRSQNIMNAELPNSKINTNAPPPHSTPTSATNSASIQNPVPSPYHNHSPTTSSSTQDGVIKRMAINDSASSKLPITNFPKRNDYAPPSSLQPIILSEPSTSTGIQQLSHQQQQENYYRYYQGVLQRQAQHQQSQPPHPLSHQQQLQSDRYVERFPGLTNHLPMHDLSPVRMNYRLPWRGPMSPSVPFISRNYGLRNNWALDPCNLLSSLSPVALQNYTTPFNVGMQIGMGGTKQQINQIRNCDTPHLGKVECSPNTSKTLKCSNCGRSGSTFKCLGCEMTFYCDQSCQARHWVRHVTSCPKKMPKLKKVMP